MWFERLKELRTEKGLRQTELANLLNIPKTTYWSWERGICQPSIEILLKLSNIFDCSVDYLLNSSEINYGKQDTAPTYTVWEKELINNYRKCTKVQQAQALGYIEAFAQINEQQNNSNKSIG